jgi:putative transposase
VPRVPRTALPDGYFHVFSRAVAAAGRLFRDDEDCETFLDLFWHTVGRSRWTCHALCLMGTHYHLVLDATQPDLSRGLERLNWRYARYFNQRHGLFGHVFANRFSARSIEDEQYLYEACAYVVLNPVRAGLCATAEDWRWSYSSFGLETC